MKTIASTTVSSSRNCTRRFRFVLRLDSSNRRTPYVVHLETDPGTPEAGFHNGDYCPDMQSAALKLQERADRAGLRVLDAQGSIVWERITA
jgi:hypothetical protein